MKSVCTILLSILCICPSLAFQTQDVLLAKIEGREIRSGEVLYAFQKNRDPSELLAYDSLEEYLDQYINFKLKVLEARAQGYDTLSAFNEELEGYISQIRKPYLNNEVTAEKLVREVYSRMHTEIDASHILINVKSNAAPKDTLKAYQLIDSLRTAVGSKEQFEELAKKFSQDGSANIGGKLGWFSAMDMVSPFEDGAYKTQVGEVSDIVRSSFGYHILYINKKRVSKGRLKTSHIFFNTQQRSQAQTEVLANSVYDSLTAGANWNEMARKYSDDSRTKMQGGQLPLAKIKQLPDDFMNIAYSLEKVGDISKPSVTQFGWHIVRLDAVEPIPAFNELEADITQLLKRSGRNTLENEQLIDKLKSENGFSQTAPILKQTIGALAGLKKDSIKSLKGQSLFSLRGKVVSVGQFIDFLPSQNIALNEEILLSLYDDFEKNEIIAYEDSLAPIKYPEYGYLLKEYEEGLLLFEIMQKEVWNKGIEDSIGAKDYFVKNIDKYQVEERFIVQSVSGIESDMMDKLKSLNKGEIEEMSLDSLAKKHFSEKVLSLLKIVKRTIKASEIPSFEATGLKSGSWIDNTLTGEHYFVEDIIPAGPYAFEEIRGMVISDFQDYLDGKWVQALREKRSIIIYKEALKSISTN